MTYKTFVVWCCFKALLLGLASSAHAENGCPAAYYPVRIPIEWLGDCAPIPDYYSEDSQPTQPKSSDPTAPVDAYWVSQWGALAIDTNERAYGAAVKAPSRHEAEKQAISLCEKGGGKACKVFGWMSDKCQALAWGDNGPYGTTANTKERAAERALNMCTDASGNCKIYHSSCSYNIHVRK